MLDLVFHHGGDVSPQTHSTSLRTCSTIPGGIFPRCNSCVIIRLKNKEKLLQFNTEILMDENVMCGLLPDSMEWVQKSVAGKSSEPSKRLVASACLIVVKCYLPGFFNVKLTVFSIFWKVIY